MANIPLGYEDEPVPSVVFTQAELDMIYFTCLHDIGHPQAEEYQLADSGFETLLKALTKIANYLDSLMTNGEPDVVQA